MMTSSQSDAKNSRAVVRGEGDMPATLPPETPARHYGRVSRVAEYAARQLGLKPGTVHQSVYGHAPVHHRLATILEAAIGLGDHAMVERLMRPIEHVLGRCPVEPLDPKLICQARATDAAEDVAETHYLARPTRETLRGWLLEIRRERADLLRLDAAITAKLEATP